MIDYLALGLTHALIVIALLRVIRRGELDREDPLADSPAEPARPTPRAARRRRRQREEDKRGGDKRGGDTGHA